MYNPTCYSASMEFYGAPESFSGLHWSKIVCCWTLGSFQVVSIEFVSIRDTHMKWKLFELSLIHNEIVIDNYSKIVKINATKRSFDLIECNVMWMHSMSFCKIHAALPKRKDTHTLHKIFSENCTIYDYDMKYINIQFYFIRNRRFALSGGKMNKWN